MKSEVIKRRTASEVVADQILAQLRSKNLKPGEKLPPERALVKMFGAGRSSVREAVKALSVMGYLQVIQGRGTYVAKDADSAKPNTEALIKTLTAVNMHSLLETRRILECKSAELAAQRGDSRQILHIGEAIIEMQKPNQDNRKFLSADKAFHLAVADAAENPLIYELVKLLVELVHQNDTAFPATHKESREKTIESVNNVLFYVRQGDGKMAARSMSDHFNVITRDLPDIISDDGRRAELSDWAWMKKTATVRP